MRVSAVLVALAAVASATTLGKRQYPSCAMSCAQSADYDGCSPTNNTCMCKSQKFVDSMAACLVKSCTGDDLSRAQEISNALCVAAGVTLTSSATATPTATGTGAAASTPTSSSNAAINLSGSPMIGALAAVAGVVFAL
ncbi:unnamed protein product [Rhizoctonia solani]|uniref:CFEM domain-containing protein n=3 Tax=Rhizoctonia solani TaxID=456999 RepID=A0A8H3HQN4_9AGAM|nr:CFEM domain protein [Rhizoctonia solani AG-3 Rhs1AP]KEP49118.1 CFEM domain protein [Rhizoctonia solani 123E]CAE6433642.1 unnamed protein product [Rhizoctonia solani]CAE6533779.1 unnamed protein product [Rhizoctonia solani]